MDTMTMQRFAQLADAWGGDVTRWPPADQAGATRVLASADGDVARALLSEAHELDLALRRVAPSPPSMRLRETILAGIPSDPPHEASSQDADPGNPAVLGYETRWFPRPRADDAATPATSPSRRAPARQAAPRASRSHRAARAGGIGRVWRELGGARVAGPALAAALVVGVALGALRSPGWLDAGPSPAAAPGATATAGSDDLLDAALLDAGYEEYLL